MCTDLDSPLNGTVSYSSDTADLPVGTTATFQCDAGFNLIGIATVDCLTSGNWSAREPECKIKGKGSKEQSRQVVRKKHISRCINLYV